MSPIPLNHPELKLFASNRHNRAFYNKGLIGQRAESVFGEREMYIYQNKTVLPRYFLAAGLKIFSDRKKLLKELGKTDIAVLRRQVWLTADDLPSGLGESLPMARQTGGRIIVAEQTPSHLEIDVKTGSGAFLVVTNNYHRLWRARIGGRAVPVLPAYLTFQAVPVPIGRHKVVLDFGRPNDNYD